MPAVLICEKNLDVLACHAIKIISATTSVCSKKTVCFTSCGSVCSDHHPFLTSWMSSQSSDYSIILYQDKDKRVRHKGRKLVMRNRYFLKGKIPPITLSIWCHTAFLCLCYFILTRDFAPYIPLSICHGKLEIYCLVFARYPPEAWVHSS